MSTSAREPGAGPQKASGLVLNLHLAKIGVMSVPDRPGIASTVLGALSGQGISAHFVVEVSDLNNRSHIVFCVEERSLEAALRAVDAVCGQVHAEKVVHQPGVAMVSVYGPHFRDRPGSAATAFAALASVGVNILAISTSISSISCLLDAAVVDRATAALAETFGVPECAVLVSADGLSRPYRASR